MVGRITLAATLVAGALVATAPVIPGWAAESRQGAMTLPWGADEAIDLGNPHHSRLTKQQQEQLDRAAAIRQQQEVAQWSKLLGGEPAQVQPIPGGGLANPHG